MDTPGGASNYTCWCGEAFDSLNKMGSHSRWAHRKPVEEKECCGCRTLKPIAEFYVRPKPGKSYFRSLCIPCFKDRSYWRRIECKFGLTRSGYEQLLESQDYKCAICGVALEDSTRRHTARRLDIDHCHRTGKVRGSLCRRCNLLLGEAEDSVQLLREAADYLEAANA